MIQLHDFSIGYGERTLLHEVEAAIPKGSLTALIGRNGTGKSTLLRAIAAVRTYEQRTTIRYQVSEISAFYPDCW